MDSCFHHTKITHIISFIRAILGYHNNISSATNEHCSKDMRQKQRDEIKKKLISSPTYTIQMSEF